MSSATIACLTSDPGSTTLYGLTYKPTLSTYGGQITLFKSRSNPSSINDIDWTTISTETNLQGSFLTHEYTSMSCAINSAGVFTAIGYYSNNRTTTQGTRIDSTPGMVSLKAVQFVPRKVQPPPSSGGRDYGVMGDWIPVEIESNYNRTAAPDYKDQKLFYVKDGGSGVETLVHAYIDTVATIRIGRVEGATFAPTLNYTTSFQNDAFAFGNASNIAAGNNELFVYSSGSNPILSVITLTNINNSTGTKPSLRIFDASATVGCQNATKILSTTWKSSYHLLCLKAAVGQEGSDLGLLASIDNTLTDSTIRLVHNITEDYVTYATYPLLDNLVAIGFDNPAQPQPFAVLMTKITYGTVSLGPASPGSIRFRASFYVNNAGADSRDQKDIDPTLVATICAAVLLLLFFGWYIFRRLCRARKQRLVFKSQTSNNDSADDDLTAIELGSRTTGSPSAPPSAPPLIPPEYFPPYESVQPTGLTAHPQPSVVTTLGASTSTS